MKHLSDGYKPFTTNYYERDGTIPTHSKCEVKKEIPFQETKKSLGSQDVCKMAKETEIMRTKMVHIRNSQSKGITSRDLISVRL